MNPSQMQKNNSQMQKNKSQIQKNTSQTKNKSRIQKNKSPSFARAAIWELIVRNYGDYGLTNVRIAVSRDGKIEPNTTDFW